MSALDLDGQGLNSYSYWQSLREKIIRYEEENRKTSLATEAKFEVPIMTDADSLINKAPMPTETCCCVEHLGMVGGDGSFDFALKQYEQD